MKALLKDGQLIGVFILSRDRVRIRTDNGVIPVHDKSEGLPEGYEIVNVESVNAPTGPVINLLPSTVEDRRSAVVAQGGRASITFTWDVNFRAVAEQSHDDRMNDGFEHDGEFYPTLKKDRDGLNGVIAGFTIAGKLFDKYVEENGPPRNQQETNAMIETGAIPPEYRVTSFEWSDGRFLAIDLELAEALAGKMALATSRSFIQKELEQAVS